MKKKWLYLAIGLIAAIAFAWWLYVQLQIDSCLDAGGQWNYAQSVCNK